MNKDFIRALENLAICCPDQEIAMGVNPETVYEIRKQVSIERAHFTRFKSVEDSKFRNEEVVYINGVKFRLVPMAEIERKEYELWRIYFKRIFEE